VPPDKDDEQEPPPPPIRLTGDSSLHRAEEPPPRPQSPASTGDREPTWSTGFRGIKSIFIFVLSAVIIYIVLRGLGIL